MSEGMGGGDESTHTHICTYAFEFILTKPLLHTPLSHTNIHTHTHAHTRKAKQSNQIKAAREKKKGEIAMIIKPQNGRCI